MDIATVTNFVTTTGWELLMKIAAALAFWIIGRWLIGKVIHLIQAGMSRNSIDPTLTKYLGSIISVILNIVLVMGILGYFGIQTTSFAALLAGAGVAIGAAWSGLLAHFAAGAFLLILRPFKVGDFISAGGITGTVKEIGLFGTTFVTPDNVQTVMGNNKVFSDTIQNFTTLPIRRVDRTAQLANGVEPLDAIARLTAAVVAIPNVSKETPPEIKILDFKPEGPVIAVRPYTNNDHYWQVYFDTNEAIARVCKDAAWPIPARPFIDTRSAP
jgi:small conductance mechanosensitive channel